MGFLLGAAMLGAVAFAGIFLLIAAVLKTVFWAVTLPIRLVFSLLFFPIWLARTALRAVGLLILAPILAAGGVLVAGAIIVAGLLAVFVPLLLGSFGAAVVTDVVAIAALVRGDDRRAAARGLAKAALPTLALAALALVVISWIVNPPNFTF